MTLMRWSPCCDKSTIMPNNVADTCFTASFLPPESKSNYKRVKEQKKVTFFFSSPHCSKVQVVSLCDANVRACSLMQFVYSFAKPKFCLYSMCQSVSFIMLLPCAFCYVMTRVCFQSWLIVVTRSFYRVVV